MTCAPDNLSAILAARVPLYWPDLGIRAVTVEPVRRRAISPRGWRPHRTYRALLDLGKGGRRILLVHAKTGPNVGAEYRILEALWRRGFGRDGPARIPAPLDLVHRSGLRADAGGLGPGDAETLVTAHAPGRQLLGPLAASLLAGVRLLGRRWRRRRLDEVADWLVRFQEATRARRPTTLADYLDRIIGELESVDAPRGNLAARLRTEVRASAWGRYALPQASVHKDFSARNILYGRGRTTVVDWEGGSAWPQLDVGPILLDALTFSTNLLALGRLPGVGWCEARRAADEFLTVYRRRTQPQLPQEVVALAERIVLVHYAADYAGGRHAISPVRSRAADRCVRYLLRRVEEGIAR